MGLSGPRGVQEILLYVRRESNCMMKALSKSSPHHVPGPICRLTVAGTLAHGQESGRPGESSAIRTYGFCFECYEQDHRLPKSLYSDRLNDAHYFAIVGENYYALTQGQQDWLYNRVQTLGFAYPEGTAKGVNAGPLSVFGSQENTPYESPAVPSSQNKQTKTGDGLCYGQILQS